jgi:hypothetical protein
MKSPASGGAGDIIGSPPGDENDENNRFYTAELEHFS